MPYEAIVNEAKTLSFDECVSLIGILSTLLKEKKMPEKKKTNDYPEGFFDLFGSDPDFDVEEPEEIPWELDAPRESF